MQTLYLEGSSPIAVLLEGPALRIRQRDRADVFTPLARLARIVVRGEVHWRAAALGACMDWNVPITFLDRDGNARGAAITLRPVLYRSDLPALLEAACTTRDWPGPWADWLRAMERTEIQGLRRRAGLKVADLRPATVRRVCMLRGVNANEQEGLHEKLASLLEVRVAARLTHEGLGPAMLSGSLGGIAPARDLTRALGWRLWPAAWRLSAYLACHEAKHREPTALRHRLVRFFEAEVPMLDKAMERCLHALLVFLGALTR